MNPTVRHALMRSLAHLLNALSIGLVISYSLIWLTGQELPLTEALTWLLAGLCFSAALDVLGKRLR